MVAIIFKKENYSVILFFHKKKKMKRKFQRHTHAHTNTSIRRTIALLVERKKIVFKVLKRGQNNHQINKCYNIEI